ncbi:MAG: hypothetical protein WA414_07760 [Acidobacteriaceae bacterium]
MRSVWPIRFAALTLAVTLSAHAQDPPPDVQAFAAQYVAAYNAKDLSRVESLYIPQSRACITPANRDVYDAMMSQQMRDRIPPHYMLSLVPVNEGNLKALSSLGYFAVNPERELHIDYEYAGTSDGGTIVLWLVRQNGRWMADFPCMTEQGIKDFRDNAAEQDRYKAIAAAIKDPLRSELIQMVRAHKTGEAAARYQQVKGGTMQTAMLVINALQDDAQ